jgi:hypothetical protein
LENDWYGMVKVIQIRNSNNRFARANAQKIRPVSVSSVQINSIQFQNSSIFYAYNRLGTDRIGAEIEKLGRIKY